MSNQFWNRHVFQNAPSIVVDLYGYLSGKLATAEDVDADGFDSSPIDQ